MQLKWGTIALKVQNTVLVLLQMALHISNLIYLILWKIIYFLTTNAGLFSTWNLKNVLISFRMNKNINMLNDMEKKFFLKMGKKWWELSPICFLNEYIIN